MGSYAAVVSCAIFSLAQDMTNADTRERSPLYCQHPASPGHPSFPHCDFLLPCSTLNPRDFITSAVSLLHSCSPHLYEHSQLPALTRGALGR